MNTYKSTGLQVFLLAAILFIAPLFNTANAGSQPIVAVSILPQSFFVKAMAGHGAQVLVMVPPGASPATYEPKPKQLALLTRCSVYFAQGLPFESAWLPRFVKANPHLRILHCYRGIERMPIETHGQQHIKLGASPSQLDPHVWLSPPLALLEARNMLEGLLRADLPHKETYEQNFRRLAQRIVDLDLRIRNIFTGIGQHNCFMVYHPAWGYFARTYRLTQIAVEKGGRKPLARDLKQLIEYARKKGFKELFVQPQISGHGAHVIAQSIGAKLVFLDPLAAQWDKNLLKSAKQIKRALR